MRRKLAAAAAAGAALLLLAGCTGGGDSGTPSADGETTVSWWTWNPDEPTAAAYIEAFEAEHPDINIEQRYMQYADYASAVTLGIQSGSGPDVFGVQVGSLAQQFAPLADDLTPVISEALGDDWSEQVLATDQFTIDGKLIALPWTITGGGLVWANQNVVDDLGLTVPTTAAELETFCAAVQAAGVNCIQQGAKDAWQNIDVYQTIINQIAPGAFYEALAGDVPFAAADFEQAFDVWKSFFDDGIFEEGALGYSAYPDAMDAFRKGEATLIIMGSWENYTTTQSALDGFAESLGDPALAEARFVPYFFPEIVPNGTTGTMFGGPDVGFAVASNSKVKDAANTFATWLAASQTGQELIAKNVTQPALASVPIDVSNVVTDAQKAAIEAQTPALSDLVGARQISDPAVETALGDALSAVASGQISSSDAAAQVQAAIDASK